MIMHFVHFLSSKQIYQFKSVKLVCSMMILFPVSKMIFFVNSRRNTDRRKFLLQRLFILGGLANGMLVPLYGLMLSYKFAYYNYKPLIIYTLVSPNRTLFVGGITNSGHLWIPYIHVYKVLLYLGSYRPYIISNPNYLPKRYR